MDKSFRPVADPFHWVGIDAEWQELGLSLKEALVSLPPSQLTTHAYIIGATGSGKTNFLHHLIAQDVRLRHSFIIIDFRGDQVSAALEICAGRVTPDLVALFDLREKERPLGFNPLFGAGEPYFRALSVLDAVASESESWGVQLADTMRNALLLLAETSEPLTKLEGLFFNIEYRETLIRMSGNESVRQFWERFGEISKDKQAALATPVLNKVSLLLSTSTLRRTLGSAQPLDLGRHLNTPGSVTLVSLAADEMHAAGRMLGNLMLSAICREIFARVNTPEKARVPIRLYVDEFEHFSSSAFEHILAEGRRFGLSLVIAHQTLAQLTPKMRSIVLGNVGVKVVFRTGRDDAAVLSKDLTGDAKELELTELAVGEAFLWRRAQPLILLEVNRPIVRNVGKLSLFAEKYLKVIKANHPVHLEASVASVGVQERPKPQRARVVAATSKVEDWL